MLVVVGRFDKFGNIGEINVDKIVLDFHFELHSHQLLCPEKIHKKFVTLVTRVDYY